MSNVYEYRTCGFTFDWKTADGGNIFCFCDISRTVTITPKDFGSDAVVTKCSLAIRGYRGGELVLDFPDIGLTDADWYDLQDCIYGGYHEELYDRAKNITKGVFTYV